MPYQQPFLDIALNALTQEQLIQHLRERLLEKDKLTQEIEQLKKENAELGEENTYMKNVPCPPVDENEKLKKEIEELKKEKEELERFNDRLEEKIEKLQDPVLHDRDIRGDNFDIRVCYGYIQECIERITGEYDDGELDDSVYREVAQSIDVGINNFIKNGTIGSIQELECAITEAIEKDPVYNKIVKEDEEDTTEE
jgi:DNA repair exonuclease SbcCD ATPase subunit